jgi:hypothetical protein
MNDVEIASLLDDAGYRYDPLAGLFFVAASRDDETYNAEDVADQLEIPLDDLIRWQQEQGHADEMAAD